MEKVCLSQYQKCDRQINQQLGNTACKLLGCKYAVKALNKLL